MGIKRLNQFLKLNAKEAYVTFPFSHFKGEKIAIDSGIVMYQLMSKANKVIINQTNLKVDKPCRRKMMNVFLKLLSNFIAMWKNQQITPLFVFDGQVDPEKYPILYNRYIKKHEKREKIEKLYHTRNVPLLKKALSSLIEFSEDEKALFKRYIKSLNVPTLTAPGEAEKLCCMLCRDQYVKAVYTLDTDAFVYGCPLTIIDYKDKLTCVDYDKILTSLNLTPSMFVDLCILFGCDYNICKAPFTDFNLTTKDYYQLIKMYYTIEQLPFIVDKQKLNYIYCRNEFQIVHCRKLVDSHLLTF